MEKYTLNFDYDCFECQEFLDTVQQLEQGLITPYQALTMISGLFMSEINDTNVQELEMPNMGCTLAQWIDHNLALAKDDALLIVITACNHLMGENDE